MTKQQFKSAVLRALLVCAGVVAGGEAALAYQPYMFTARGDLRAARAALVQAVPDKAGHRVNAMGLIDQALGEVNAGIAAGAH